MQFPRALSVAKHKVMHTHTFSPFLCSFWAVSSHINSREKLHARMRFHFLQLVYLESEESLVCVCVCLSLSVYIILWKSRVGMY